MTLFEALKGGAFDLVNWQHSREFEQNFSKKSDARGLAGGVGGGGMGGFGIDRYINRAKTNLAFYRMSQRDASTDSEGLPPAL